LPGTTLEFREDHGRLVAVKTTPADPVAKVYGCLGRRFNTDTFMRQIRGRSRLITAVDTNVLLDVFGADAQFGEVSAETVWQCLYEGALIAC